MPAVMSCVTGWTIGAIGIYIQIIRSLDFECKGLNPGRDPFQKGIKVIRGDSLHSPRIRSRPGSNPEQPNRFVMALAGVLDTEREKAEALAGELDMEGKKAEARQPDGRSRSRSSGRCWPITRSSRSLRRDSSGASDF
ncbi:hypothetical protein ACP70R_007558 [Stipagrostis hirtigluma subsp. patula]